MISHETNIRMAIAKEQRKKTLEKNKRHIVMGYINGKILKNGAILITEPKGIQHWFDTRTLVKMVNDAFQRNNGVCHVNKKWQLQIRGKHLRRLLKAMPEVEYKSGILIRKGK